MAERERWYFTKEELEDSPSRRCGITADKELLYRQQAANLIQDMGQKLKVNQLVINTAIVYMHRFYTLHSFSQFHRNAISSCALFLAAKVEEQHRKLEHVIKMSQLCLCRENCDTKSEQFQQLAAELVHHENLMLRTLGFDLNVQHPHTWVVNCLELVRAKKDLAQTSYIMATNSLHLTTMCLQYKPAAVACICIYFVCKWAGFELARSFEGKDWWTYVDPTVTQEMLEKTTAEFLDVLKKCPARLKKITNTNSSSRQMNNSHKIPMDRFSDNSKLSLKYNHSRSSRSMIEQQKKESEQHESSRNNKNIDDYRYHHRRENLNAMPKELAHFPTMNSSTSQSSSSSGLLMKETNALSTKSQPHSNISSRNNNNNNNNTNSSALVDEKPLKTTMADNNNSYDSISNSDDKTKTNQSVINNSNNNTNNNNNINNNNRLSCNMNNNLNDSLFTQDSQMFSDSENSDYSAVKKEIPDLEMEFTDNEESDYNIGLNSTFIMNDSSDPKLIPNSFAEFNQQFNHNKNNTTSTNNDVKCPQTSSSTLPLYNEFTSNNLTNFVKNDPETLGEKSNMMANKKPTIVGNRNIDGDFNKHGQQTSNIHLDPLKSIPSIPNSHYDPGAFSLSDSKPPLSALPQQTMQQQPSHPPQPQIISSGLLQSAPGCILGGDVKNFPAVQSSAAFNQLINDTYHSSSSNNLLNSHEETSNHSRSSRHKHHKEKHKHKDKHKHKEKHKHKHKSKDKDKHTTSFSLVSPENQPLQNQSLKLTIRKNDLLTDNAAGIDEHGDGNIIGGIGLGVKTKSINNSEVKLPKKSSSTIKESILSSSATSKSSRKSTHKTKKAPSQSPPPPLPPTTTTTLPLKLKINLKNQNVLSLELSKNKKRKI